MVDPISYFEDRDDGSLIVFVMVVLISALAAHSSGFLLSFELIRSLPMSVMQFYILGMIFSVLFGIGGYLVVWLVYSGIFHGISTYLGGEGDFKTTLRYTGWGFVPVVFQGILTVIAMGIALRSVSPPATSDELNSFIDTIQSSPELQLAQLIGVVFVLWQAVIWLFAVKRAQQLTFRRSVFVILVPVCLTILWQLNSAIQFL